ncbi:unnamed protein product [Closterium sp. NIES-54]
MKECKGDLDAVVDSLHSLSSLAFLLVFPRLPAPILSPLPHLFSRQAFCVALSTALSQFRDVLACLDVHRHSPLLAALPPAPLSASSLLPAAGGSARREGQERQQQQQRWRQEGRGEEERKGAESESVALRTGVSEAGSTGRDESGGAAPGLREGGLAAGDAAGRVGHGGHGEAGRGRQEQRREYLRLRHLLAFLSPWFVRLECLVSFIDECRSVGTGTGTHGCW